MKHFEDMVLAGKLDEAEKYLSGFTQVHENMLSTKTYFELRRQKFLEALDKHERVKALDILMKDIKAFSTYNEEVFKEASLLLPLENFRQHESLARYGDPKTERRNVVRGLKQCIQENPAFSGKLLFPITSTSCLQRLFMYARAAASSSAAANGKAKSIAFL
ncbi:protein TOPLESS-RELATED PROTEIN 2-like isoform X2 [Citrus sinensis]|nr:protein TOPLESS-RELATED PROTEIN 2-like isoform X2 [Citrus sinensis]XP_052297259.1 protein TOPLESS-RELATED PROTEIN 2-like isoform X2 [Citrus sinensis]